MFRRTCLNSIRHAQRVRTFRNAHSLSTLTVIEHQNGVVQPATLSAIAAAFKLGGPVHALLAGSGTKALADKVAKIKGIEKVLFVDDAAYDKGLPESWAPMLVENVQKGGYTHVLCAHSAFGKNMLPRAAALLDVMQVSDIVGIESEDTFVRPIYAGNAIVTIQTSDKLKLVTVRGTAYEPAKTEGGSATIEAGSDPKVASSTTWESETLTESERPELSVATRIISGGRGMKERINFDKYLVPVADLLGAAIGASRAAVDSGYADNSLQVGQTGKVVAPELYIAVGISGAIQHLAGMKDSKVISAINKDADAPIFQIADVGLVADLFLVLPELADKLGPRV